MIEQAAPIIHELLSGDNALLALALIAIASITGLGVFMLWNVLGIARNNADALVKNAHSTEKLCGVMGGLKDIIGHLHQQHDTFQRQVLEQLNEHTVLLHQIHNDNPRK